MAMAIAGARKNLLEERDMSNRMLVGRCIGQKNTARRQSALWLAAAAATFCFAPKLVIAGTNGTYSNSATNGLWSTSTNWTGGTIANGQDGIADFSTLSLPAANTVHLDTARTIGQLKFGDQTNNYGWTLDNNGNAANTLTLSTSTNVPVINVSNQSVNISTSITGTQGFTLTGGGILTLSGNNSYTGVTNVSNGTLVLGSNSSSTSSPTAGAVVDLDPTLSTITTSGGAVTSISDLSTAGGNSASNSGAPGSVTLTTLNGHKALLFNGASGLTDTSFSASTNPETVFVVMNPTNIAAAGALVAANAGGGNGGLELRLYQSKLQALNEGLTPYAQSSNVSANALSVVTYAYNSSGGTYYLNGTSAGTTAAPGLTGSNTLTIGYQRSYSQSQDYFNGTLGTILIYNSVLSQSQISATANFLASEYAASSTTLGTTLVNLSSANSTLSIASATQTVTSLAGVANSNVFLGGGILTVGDSNSTVFAGNISDTGTGSVGTGGELIKVGSGTLNLSGGVTNTGGVQVNAGTLIASGTYATSGATTVTGGTLSVTGTDSDTGSHSVSGGILSISGTNFTNGNFNIGSNGTLVLSGQGYGTGAISFASGGLLTLVANTSNITPGSPSTSSAIGSPSAVNYADAATTNVQLLSDSTVTFANAQPTSGTGSGAIINYVVNNLTNGSNQTLTLGTSGFATFNTTINVSGGNGYTLALPQITNASNGYLRLNASTGNLSIPGGISNTATLTVSGAGNTTIGPISGAGPLLKSGAGTLLLTDVESYTGYTNISAGTLALGSASSLTATSAISIGTGATFDISANPNFTLPSSSTILSGSGTINGSYNHSIGVLAAGSLGSVGTLNINGNLTLAGGTVDVSISGSNNSTGGLANDLINATGGLNLVGNNTLTLGAVTPTLPSGTTWTVLTYNASSGLTGTGTLNVSTSAFTVVEVPGAVELKYLSGVVGADVWTGASGNSTWDTASVNFVLAGTNSAISFTNGDSVTFDDTSSVTSVNLGATLLPGSVTVNSNNSNYTFSGSGSIGGIASLTKLGSSILTINSSNSYSGTTNIAGGVLVNAVSTGSGIGTGPLIVGPGATLVIGNGSSGGNPAANSKALQNSSILDNGTIVYNGVGYNYLPVAVTGTGGINVSSGTLGIGSANNYSGPVNVIGSGADLEAFEASSLGTSGLVTIDNGGVVDVGYGAFTYANAFNISGTAIATFGGTGPTTISGPVKLYDADTTLQLSNNIVLANNLTATNNQNLFTTGNGTLTLEGNVSLGTGQLEPTGNVIFAPAAAATITISSGGITGGEHVFQSGTGITILNGSNSYTGGTNVTSGTLVFNAPSALPNFSALVIGPGATAQVANYSGGIKNTLFTSGLSLSVTGKLDLGNNDLVVQNGVLGTLTAEVAQGFNGGKWNGSAGIVSSAAAADTTHLHALGIILNTADGSTTLYGGTLPAFDGASQSAATDVLIKYTYYGDTNLDGKVDASDYSRIDAAYLADKSNPTALTGWYNGDFNYDGVINGSDYTLIDNAFNTQGAYIASAIASPTDQIAGSDATSTSAVPEPASLGLLGIGATTLLSRRRRRK
jgi:autotransporter-associated beta strand protein